MNGTPGESGLLGAAVAVAAALWVIMSCYQDAWTWLQEANNACGSARVLSSTDIMVMPVKIVPITFGCLLALGVPKYRAVARAALFTAVSAWVIAIAVMWLF